MAMSPNRLRHLPVAKCFSEGGGPTPPARAAGRAKGKNAHEALSWVLTPPIDH